MPLPTFKELLRLDGFYVSEEMDAQSTILVRPGAYPGVSAVDNGTALLAAYAEAKTKTPNGNALAADNRVTIILLPGVYDLGSGVLDMDTAFIDIINPWGVCRCEPGITWDGLPFASAVSGNPGAGHVISYPNVLITSSSATYVILADTADWRLYGLHVQQTTNQTDALVGAVLQVDLFDWTVANHKYRVQNCGFEPNQISDSACIAVEDTGTSFATVGGLWEQVHTAGHFFRGQVDHSDSGAPYGQSAQIGVFIDCISMGVGWSDYGAFTGRAKRCVGGYDAFGGEGTFSGICEDCVGGNYSFGGGGSGGASAGLTNAAVAKRCYGADQSFGGGHVDANCKGRCEDCYGKDQSFGSLGEPEGTFIRCTGSDEAWDGAAGETALVMRDCRSVGRTDAIKNFQGRMDDCTIETTGSNKNAVEVLAGAKLYNNTLVATGSGKSISGGAVTIYTHGNLTNLGLHGDLIEGITGAVNIVDANVDV